MTHLFEEAPEDMMKHLFTVREEYLDDTTPSQLFHHLTTRLLFLCTKRARPDIQTPVALLTRTRVKRLVDSWDDYKKRVRVVIKYLRGTPDLALTLEGG